MIVAPNSIPCFILNNTTLRRLTFVLSVLGLIFATYSVCMPIGLKLDGMAYIFFMWEFICS